MVLFLTTIAAFFPLLITSISACTTPGLDACHDGTNTNCSTPTNDRYTNTDGSLIGTPTDTNLVSNAIYSSCYCQQCDSNYNAIDSNTLVTKCFGDLFIGYNNWFDGQEMMQSGYNADGFDDNNFMACQSSLSTDYLAPNGYLLTYITWIQPVPFLESQLPSTAISDPNGLCPGFDVQAGEHSNTDNTTNLTIEANDAVNCTCQPQVSAGVGDSGASEPIYTPSFDTICSSNYQIYWNGQGYRPNLSNDIEGNDIVSDGCGAPASVDGSTSVAYVIGATDASGSTTIVTQSTSTSTSASSTSVTSNSVNTDSASSDRCHYWLKSSTLILLLSVILF